MEIDSDFCLASIVPWKGSKTIKSINRPRAPNYNRKIFTSEDLLSFVTAFFTQFV